MARIRTVKPDFFRHELLQDLQATHPAHCPMLVFAGLFGHCDKQGVFPWRPKQLKLDILPFMSFEMAEALDLLLAAQLIRRFSLGGNDYGFIPTFKLHQQIGGKECSAPARFPAPPMDMLGKLPGSDREVSETEKNNPHPDGEVTGTAGIRKGIRNEEGKGMEVVASRAKARSAGEAVNGNAVCYIPLNDGKEFGVSKELAEELAKLYPRVDVAQTLNEIRGWNLANPSRRKTRRGVLSHINGWLSKEQNRGA